MDTLVRLSVLLGNINNGSDTIYFSYLSMLSKSKMFNLINYMMCWLINPINRKFGC